MISESYIIGTLIYGSEQLKYIPLTSIQSNHIDNTFLRIIFEACRESHDKFDNITEETVYEFTKGDVGLDYIQDYKQYVCDSRKEIESHCNELTDSFSKDNIMAGLTSIITNNEEFETSKELVTHTEQILNQVIDQVGMPGLTYDQMVERDKNQPRYEKLTLDDPFWDYTFFKNCGCNKGQMTTLFGDSKHGKSMAAMMFSRLLLDADYKGLYTSFEDRDRKYADHILKGLNNKDKINHLFVTDHSQGCSTLEDIITTTKYHKAANDISFLIVDNAQIVSVEGINSWEEKKKLVTISPALSRLAIEHDLWVLLLSQITNQRSRDRGYARQPKIHDIYGSGQIRKDSFMGISIFKPSEVEELLVKNEFNGDVRGIKHPNSNGELWPLSTVLLRQELIREGEKYWKNVVLDINDDGLARREMKRESQPKETTPF